MTKKQSFRNIYSQQKIEKLFNQKERAKAEKLALKNDKGLFNLSLIKSFIKYGHNNVTKLNRLLLVCENIFINYGEDAYRFVDKLCYETEPLIKGFDFRPYTLYRYPFYTDIPYAVELNIAVYRRGTCKSNTAITIYQDLNEDILGF